MKPKIIQINSVCGYGSTGRIIADLSRMEDFDTLVCYGRKTDLENVNSYRFAEFIDNAVGAARTILFDNNINICKTATEKLIKKIEEYKPDLIHLHNLHGYYVNIEMLFSFLKQYNKPVVWTLHDTWSLTGYCPILDYYDCEKYKTECENCPCGFVYPFSLFKQNVRKEYRRKKELFNSLENLTIVTPSRWLKDLVASSFLKEKTIQVINNGIDLSSFYPSKEKNKRFTALAVAGWWTKDRGLEEMNKLIPLLNKDIEVIAVGTDSDKIKNCRTIKHTDSKKELIDLYSSSHILLMPTLEDNFPTVNMESLACGTPVITYNTGGSPEIIDEKTGIVVEKGNYRKMAEEVNALSNHYVFKPEDCFERSKQFASSHMVMNYNRLYKNILNRV